MRETERHITQTNDESRDNRYETMRVSGGDEPMGERSRREEHSDIEKREERHWGERTQVLWLGGRRIEELDAAVDAIVWFPELTPCVCLGRAFCNLPSPPHRRAPRKRVHGSQNPPPRVRAACTNVNARVAEPAFIAEQPHPRMGHVPVERECNPEITPY